MIEHRCVAVYPEKEVTQNLISKWDKYLAEAAENGFNEVFSTMHLPELTLDQQLDAVVPIAALADKYHMEYTVDIGGPFITEILADEKALQRVKGIGLKMIRLDYGYSHQQVRELYEKLDIEGFVINASIYRPIQIREELAFFATLEGCRVRACHNFYPREETGLDRAFAISQADCFQRQGLPVYYCIPSHTNPRGPVFRGLPTIEEHRYMDPVNVTMEVLYDLNADGVMLADEFFSSDELRKIGQVLREEPVEIRVKVKEPYEKLVLRDHIFRYDSYHKAIRSQSSRAMAEFASRVEPDNCSKRDPGAITIDNVRYERYSGEMQVVMRPMPADERVNVVGHIDPDDLYKLKYYNQGLTFRFRKG